MKVIACIEDPDVIQKILTHLQLNTKGTAPGPVPPEYSIALILLTIFGTGKGW